MQIPQSVSKILKRKLLELLSSTEWLKVLLEEGLYKFEQLLYEAVLSLYDQIIKSLIDYLIKSKLFEKIQRALAKEKDLKKLRTRPVQLQLRTGTKIRFDSLYAKKVPIDHEGTRHLSLIALRSSDGASPMYKSICCLQSVLCPSFDVTESLLRYQGIKANSNRIRSVSLSLAKDAMKERTTVQLEQGESLKGKHVIIAIDGGRTRTKVYTNEKKSKRDQEFDTPWREPKMFVITTYDEQGRISKERKPIYDGTFGDKEMVNLLSQYLQELEIDKAASVQVLADGALWIWNRVIPMLQELGVEKEKIIETLDYYHGIEHLNDLKAYLEKDQDKLFGKLKDSLWQGDIKKMERLLKKGIPNLDIKEFKPFEYFTKNLKRIDYQTLKEQGRVCGSGIIESGIRRIINLRFKSPSTFWFPENVEKLIFMRGIALSGRWEIMMNNLNSW